MFHQFIKTFLILKFQHIYKHPYNFPFQFISSYPNACIRLFIWFCGYVVVIFKSYNVHLDQQFNSERCNIAKVQFHQQFSSTKQFIAYLAIPTRKLGFSFIQLSYLPQVNNFKLLNSKERKFKQNKQEIK